MSHEYKILEQMLIEGKISRQEFKERIDAEYNKLEQELMNDAIRAADKPPNAVRETVENMRREANKRGFEVFGRIKLRDMKTGKIYR